MWDFEGKDVDAHVVRKLLSRYPEFFRERVLGRDFAITYRIPNPGLRRLRGRSSLRLWRA